TFANWNNPTHAKVRTFSKRGRPTHAKVRTFAERDRLALTKARTFADSKSAPQHATPLRTRRAARHSVEKVSAEPLRAVRRAASEGERHVGSDSERRGDG